MRALGVSNRTAMRIPVAFYRNNGNVTLMDFWGDIAQRVLIVRKLKGLEDILPFTCVHWHLELNVDKNNSGSKIFLAQFSFLDLNYQSFV